MQAVILAAGMGKRLAELTKDYTKCMVKVNGITLIERALRQLDRLALSRIVIVTGYKAEELISYISGLAIKTEIIYVNNDIYDTTNNIYSLFLARHYLTEEDTLLLESDLIFEEAVLTKILGDKPEAAALVAKYQSWMDGTVVTVNSEDIITDFIDKKHYNLSDLDLYYKTVNIYKFSKEFSAVYYVPFLEAYRTAMGNNEYYEQVLKVVVSLNVPRIKATILEREKWYEIDNMQDLKIAESIF
jgi:choline kinase